MAGSSLSAMSSSSYITVSALAKTAKAGTNVSKGFVELINLQCLMQVTAMSDRRRRHNVRMFTGNRKAKMRWHESYYGVDMFSQSICFCTLCLSGSNPPRNVYCICFNISYLVLCYAQYSMVISPHNKIGLGHVTFFSVFVSVRFPTTTTAHKHKTRQRALTTAWRNVCVD